MRLVQELLQSWNWSLVWLTFVLISLLLTLLAMLDLLSSTLYMPLASIHAAGCVGDFYIALLLLGQTEDILVEDTGLG